MRFLWLFKKTTSLWITISYDDCFGLNMVGRWSPEKCLGDDPFLLGTDLFSWAFGVSFRDIWLVGNVMYKWTKRSLGRTWMVVSNIHVLLLVSLKIHWGNDSQVEEDIVQMGGKIHQLVVFIVWYNNNVRIDDEYTNIYIYMYLYIYMKKNKTGWILFLREQAVECFPRQEILRKSNPQICGDFGSMNCPKNAYPSVEQT